MRSKLHAISERTLHFGGSNHSASSSEGAGARKASASRSLPGSPVLDRNTSAAAAAAAAVRQQRSAADETGADMVNSSLSVSKQGRSSIAAQQQLDAADDDDVETGDGDDAATADAYARGQQHRPLQGTTTQQREFSYQQLHQLDAQEQLAEEDTADTVEYAAGGAAGASMGAVSRREHLRRLRSVALSHPRKGKFPVDTSTHTHARNLHCG